MPKKEEEALTREANKKGLTGKEKDAYIYGTLRKQGWKPKGEKAAKPRKKAAAKRKMKKKK